MRGPSQAAGGDRPGHTGTLPNRSLPLTSGKVASHNIAIMDRVALLVAIALIALESPVEAYLDPGTGSMLLQILLGGVAAVGVIAKLYWHRLIIVFRGALPRGKQ